MKTSDQLQQELQELEDLANAFWYVAEKAGSTILMLAALILTIYLTT